jgi:protein TonB
MKEKKSAKANLDNKRVIFIEIGLIVALAIMYMAFELKFYDVSNSSLNVTRQDAIVEEEMVEVTQQEKIELPPPPPQQTIVFHEVEDNIVLHNDIVIDAEASVTTEVAAADWSRPTTVAEETIVEEEVFLIVEENPSYPGGDEARLTFLRKNMKYPQMAKESGIQGQVFVGFVVERDGSITQVKILRGIGGGCDEEALRVAKMMPKWNPGKQRGKAVRVSYNMPIKFILQD